MRENNGPMWPPPAASLVRDNALRFCELLGTEPICPINEEFLGQMFAIPIHTPDPDRLKRYLFQTHRVEIAINLQDNLPLMRYSINAFNSQDDLDRLYTALQETADKTALLSLVHAQ